MPMAGTERKAGGDAANTGPIDPDRVWVGPGPGMPDSAGSDGASLGMGVGCIGAAELSAALVGAGSASEVAGNDHSDVTDADKVCGRAPSPQPATQKRIAAAVVAFHTAADLRSARPAGPARPQSVQAPRGSTLVHFKSGLSKLGRPGRPTGPQRGTRPKWLFVAKILNPWRTCAGDMRSRHRRVTLER
jgi:hypothetical protein